MRKAIHHHLLLLLCFVVYFLSELIIKQQLKTGAAKRVIIAHTIAQNHGVILLIYRTTAILLHQTAIYKNCKAND